MTERTMSLPELASRLGVSPYTVRSWLRQRRLGYFKLGRRVLIAESELSRFMEAGRVSAKKEEVTTGV